MAISVGSVSVSVVPDASNFARDMKAKLSNLPSVQITVDAVTTQARAAIEELRGKDITVNVNADTAAARAEIDAAARNRDATINVHADTGGASAEIAAVGAAASSSSGGVNGLLVAGAALGPAIIPVAGAVAAALAAIGPAALAGVAGIGTLALGFSGIGAAVKALGAQNDGAAAAAAKSASTQVNAAAAIQSAEASLANARAAAGDSAVRAAAAVRDAQRGVADATREAAAGVMSALQGQEQAERSLSTAQASQRQAQLDLTAARLDAKQALEDLAFQVQDGELSQRQANLSVSQAQQNLWAVQADPKATELQRQQAQLAYDQAVQSLNEITVKNQRLKDEKAKADKAGVDGSKQVTAAQAKLNDATQATVDAQKAVKDAYAATAEARRAGAEKVAVAEERVTAAQQAQASAARQSAFSIAQAQAAVAAAHRSAAAGATTATAATTALDKAMADLSPAGQKFAKFIFGLKGKFDELKATAQAGLLPGLQDGIEALMPLFPTFNRIVGNAATAMGGLFREAGQALQAPFWRSFFTFIEKTVGPNLTAFGHIIGNVAKGFAGLLMAFQPVADQMISGLLDLSKGFADWATHLGSSSAFQSFLAYIQDVGPKVAKTFGDLVLATFPLLRALAPLGGVVLGVVDALAQFIAKCTPGQLLAIAGAISAVVIGLALFGGPVAAVNAIVVAIAALAAGAVYAYENFKPFRDFIDNFASGTMSAFRTALGYVKQALADNSGQMTQLWNACKTVAGFIMTYVVPAIEQYLQQALVGLGLVIAGAISAIGGMVTAFNGLRDGIVNAWSQYIQPALQFMVAAFLGMFKSVADGAATLFGWVPGIGDHLKDAAKAFDGFSTDAQASLDGVDGSVLTQSIDATGGAVFNVTPKVKALATTADTAKGSISGLYSAADTATVSFDGLGSSMDAALGLFQSLPQLEASVESALDGLAGKVGAGTKAFVDNHKSIDLRTESGRQLQQKIIDEIKAQSDLAAGVLKQTHSSDKANDSWNRGIKQLKDHLIQMGFSKSEADALAKKYGAIPDMVKTEFKTPGMTAAQEGVKELNDRITKLHDKNLKIGINFAESDHKLPGTDSGDVIGHGSRYGAGFATGGYTGPGSKYQPAGIVHADEYVIRKESTNKLGLAVLDHLNAFGELPTLGGYANGGPVVTANYQYPTGAAVDSFLSGSLLKFANANINSIMDGLVQPFDGSKGAAQWASLVSRVLTELHRPLSEMAAVLRRIDFESGGSPTAINLTDSNARAGHPSQGLMQTIPTTFSAYAGPYRGRGITDPLANIYAGVNYALHTYGDLKNIDPLNRPKGYDAGGWLQPGLTTVFNGTQKPEAIFTHEQFQSIKDGGLSGKGGPSVNYNGPVYVVDPEQIGRQNVNAMRDAIAVENLTGAL